MKKILLWVLLPITSTLLGIVWCASWVVEYARRVYEWTYKY